MKTSMKKRFGLAAVVTAATLGLAAATSASAQDYGDEEIQVTAPRHHTTTTDIPGTPIRDVAMSRQVRFDDLDLRTRHGARILRSRIRSTAQTLCRQLEFMHPVATSDSPPCYRMAVHDAMIQVNDAIASARED